MSLKKVLITGATGATGGGAARLLLNKGIAVRALVLAEDQHAKDLQDCGAEIVVGDLLDFNSVRAALDGIDLAYFVFPVQPGHLEATAFFAQAAIEARLELIVNISQATAREDAKSHDAQAHWIAERVFDRSGVPVTHVVPTLFADWFLYVAFMVKAGVVRTPFGTGKHAAIASEDIARVVAVILADPESHSGKRYPLYGAGEMTFAGMSAAIGQTLGRDLRYEQVDMDSFLRDVRSNGGDFSPYFIQHLGEIVKDQQNGITAGWNNLVETITGVPPITIPAFALAHRASFE